MSYPLPYNANDPRTLSEEVREEIGQLERNIAEQFAQNIAGHLLPQSLWNVQVFKLRACAGLFDEEIRLDRKLVVDVPLASCIGDALHQNLSEIIDEISSEYQTHLHWPAARDALERTALERRTTLEMEARGVTCGLPPVKTFTTSDRFWSECSELRTCVNKCEADCRDLERIKADIDEAAGKFITDYHEELVYQDESNPSNAPYYLSQLLGVNTGHSDPNLDRGTVAVITDYWMGHQVAQSLIDSTEIQRGQAQRELLDLVQSAVVATVGY